MRKHGQTSLPLHIEASSTASTESSHNARSPSDAHARVQQVSVRNQQSVAEENALITALATRAFHLPGFGYFADWRQFLCNNHLIFGMCCHHPQHPLKTKQRMLNLLGSALFGLAVTNIIWLGYIYYDQDPDSILFKVSFTSEADATEIPALQVNVTISNNYTADAIADASNFTFGDDKAATFEVFLPSPKDEFTAETLEKTLTVTKGMILLWTVGGIFHAVFDSTIWYLSACVCCLPGNRCERLGWMRRMGSAFTIFVVLLVTAVATFLVVLRATLIDHTEIEFSQSNSAGLMDDTIDVSEGFRDVANNVGAFEFVIGYFIEFVLALFFYYPLFMTLLFSGYLNCLGCGKIRLLGGRPFEMRQLEERQAETLRLQNKDKAVSSRVGLVTGSQCLSSKPLERGSYHTIRTNNESGRSMRGSNHSTTHR